jgi:energy-converting hydrogenase Eha subunit C
LPNIKILNIERADLLLSEDFVELFTLHENIMKNLTCLKLVGCWKLDDSGMKTIVNTCAGSLECLSVRSCKLLTAKGIQNAVTHCKKLRYLDIAHVIQLDEPIMMLLLKLAPLLKVLIIDDDTSNEGTLSHIISKKPQLLIKRSFSEYFKHQTRFN